MIIMNNNNNNIYNEYIKYIYIANLVNKKKKAIFYIQNEIK